MERKKRIKTILNANFSKWKIDVLDHSAQHKGHNNFDGKQETHFLVILKSPNKINEKKIVFHRKINELLKNEFQAGLHALEVKIIN